MRRQFEECGYSLDAQYAKYGDTPYFHGEAVEPGHVYIIGYPRCVCPEAAEAKNADPNFCECSRQSIFYVLENLLPGKKIDVKILHTALTGAENCRGRPTAHIKRRYFTSPAVVKRGRIQQFREAKQ